MTAPPPPEALPLAIDVDARRRVSGLLLAPAGARACYVFAHGAGAGMTHPFMATFAQGLAARGIATLRYQFPYMEQRAKRPDPPALAQACVRAAVATAGTQLPELPLLAGGKSFGGRMSSQAQADAPLPGVGALAFVGFPLHPAGKPSDARGAHLARVELPMLFLQGTRDALAAWSLLEPLVARLGARANLVPLAEADHAFHVPARSGRRDVDVMADMLDGFARFVETSAKR